MRRIMMFNRVSADGYFAAADGNLDWAVPEPKLDEMAAESTSQFDTYLFGRRTYEIMAQFWPHALDNPAASDPHGEGELSPATRALAVSLNESPKLVFSRTLKDATWKNTRILPELDPREVEAMKQQSGRDIIILGSGSIVSQLTEHGLIDEYHFVVNPVFLGNGQSLIRGLPKSTRLKLVEVTEYESGNVSLRYEPGQAEGGP